MALDSKIRVTDLDFANLKQGLKDFLKDQAEFSDYNFEASGLSTILNILAYNSHYQALLANYAVNELFMDTASKRSSIVSRAKELGYVPVSRKSARATINVVVTNVTGNPSSLILPAGTKFVASVNGSDYVFNTITAYEAVVTVGSPNTYTFNNVYVYEGTYVQNTFTYNELDPTVTIPNANIDTSTLSVFVRENYSDGYKEYSKVDSFLALDGTSTVYFLQENHDLKFSIYFGDDVAGNKPVNSSSILIKYINTNATEGNDGNSFTLSSTVSGWSGASVAISTVSASSGGKERETDGSVKHNALNFYGTQNRAVVYKDYPSLIIGSGVNVKSVVSWGGEDNIPPRYNTVFLSIQPGIGDILTPADKETLTAFLKNKAVANMNFSFVDPEYIDLKVETEVIYDKNALTTSVYQLETDVKTEILNFADENLTVFDGILRYSQLVNSIDRVSSSILNSNTRISLIKEIIPNLYVENRIIFSFYNQLNQDLTAPALTSSGFYLDDNPNILYFEDNKNGKIQTVYYSGETKIIDNPDVGTIDYINGKIHINPLVISGTVDSALYFYASIKSSDVVAKFNVIPRVQGQNVTVTSRADYK